MFVWCASALYPQKNETLTDLVIDDNHLNGVRTIGCSAFSRALEVIVCCCDLQMNSTLQSLSLSGFILSDEKLPQALHSNTKLTSLSLDGCRLLDVAVLAFTSMLKVLGSLCCGHLRLYQANKTLTSFLICRAV